jgi:hypothetical protein
MLKLPKLPPPNPHLILYEMLPRREEHIRLGQKLAKQPKLQNSYPLVTKLGDCLFCKANKFTPIAPNGDNEA